MTKKTRKNSGGTQQPLSPTATASDRTMKPNTPTTQSSPAANLPSEPPPSQPSPPQPESLTTLKAGSTPVSSLVESLADDLRIFLDPDYEETLNKIKKVQFYRILLHFNPATASRMSHNKDVLNAAFKKHVLPHLIPFLTQRPSVPMDTDEGDQNQPDFNPLGRKTTRKMLIEAIKRKVPKVPIPSNARRDGLLLLYQAHVDKDLVIPGQTETAKKPRYLRSNAVANEDMEDLRFALQCHAPHVFIHSIPMTHQVLVDCYLHFLLEEPLSPGSLVRGFHYSIIA